MLEVEFAGPRKHSVEQRKHFAVRVRAAAEKDEPGSFGPSKGEKARVIEVRGHDDSFVGAGSLQNF